MNSERRCWPSYDWGGEYTLNQTISYSTDAPCASRGARGPISSPSIKKLSYFLYSSIHLLLVLFFLINRKLRDVTCVEEKSQCTGKTEQKQNHTNISGQATQNRIR